MDMFSVLKTTFPVPSVAPDWEPELLRRLGTIDTGCTARNSCEADNQPGLLLPDRLGQAIHPKH
ncbi:MAG: hypothetical protein AVDCRST_MAG23-1960 [uncultured Sphingosinicella sp.]|uniref:Uncharacterized protein n=1 Tax=uncultured Sphingosinicella sp. TaxID=478748 RepID=A0A6J4U6U9_9SPHN|nr:MAG: hypothetical protein AVDCRST_MAG23-1960 [uncultured Sphingosinicella sp.]